MSQDEPANSKDCQLPSPPAAKREPGQVTLSTIGDVSVAAGDALSRASEVPQATRWLPILGFLFLAYLACCWLTVYFCKSAPWVRAFLVPLFPVLIATVAFWWRQRWKLQAKDREYKLKLWQAALVSLGHEAANAVNAIRANLTAFRLANAQLSNPEHLDEIESGTKRIEAAVQHSQDPVSWKGEKGADRKQPPEPGEIARSRIAL
jgi:hypothetical protein